MTKYSVAHNNHYTFHETVSHCALEARLQPMHTQNQSVEFSQFVVRPLAKRQRSERDRFGNHVNFFEIARGLQSFSLSAIHTVTTSPLAAIDLATTAPWEQVADRTAKDTRLTGLYLDDSTGSSYVAFDDAIRAYAKHSFVPGRPLLEAAYHLMQGLYADFGYDPRATKVETTAIDAFEFRRGVCQDFTHIAIACLRSLGLPVRYVSGYVDTSTASIPPHKITRDASHAWFSVYDNEHGWVDFDPTNNKMPDETYVRVAVGRDYHDVAPLKGQVDTRTQNRLIVSVDMTAL